MSNQQTQSLFRVLIVDDDPEIRLLLRSRLRFERDFEVVGEAGDGAEAIRLVTLLSPSVVITDFQMPTATAAEAIPVMRAAAPAMPIVLYTAHDTPPLPQEASPDASLRKGAPLGDLVAQLREVVQRAPLDVVRVDLGPFPLQQAITAYDTWVGLNIRVLGAIARGDELAESQLGGATPDELRALVRVFVHLGDTLQTAARAGLDTETLVVHVFRNDGALARRALVALGDDGIEQFWQAWAFEVPGEALSALTRMREQLIKALPASVPD
ncbi:MAG: hypothetical protein QOG90_2233 [Actinomycetota bacterium]